LETTTLDLKRAVNKAMKNQERNDLLRAEYETMSEAFQTVEEKEEEEDVC
jgi:hypothetical protein